MLWLLYTRMRVNSGYVYAHASYLGKGTCRGASIKWQAGINQMRRSSGKGMALWNCSAIADRRHQESISPTPPTLDGASAHSALTPAIAPIPRSYLASWSAAASVSFTPTPTCAQTRSSIHSPLTFT
jgi:hypothetical protein